jgi:prepilin-type N-terminal cleavage/methylation domain-containing protein
MKHTEQQGFSLIEMLVAATIFSFMVITITGVYAQVISLQRRAQGAARVQENALFIVETLSREIRFAKISSPESEDCAATLLEMEHPLNGEVKYRYDGTLKAVERFQGTAKGGSGNWEQITSPEVEFTAFAFCIDGTGIGDDQQVRITMPMTIQNKATHKGNRVTVSLQTTVVSRDLETDLTD